MMKKTLVLFTSVVVLAMVTVLFSSASENKGASRIVLNGGKRGAVSFPHLRHQNKLADCQTCHVLFPQENGSIDKMKSEGRLKSKQVMTTSCIKCHRADKKAGKTSGPTSCTQCHQKE